jgi:hypothetical protein
VFIGLSVNYVFATSESMKRAVNGMDQLRPRTTRD